MTEISEQRCRRYRRRILEISQQVTAAHVAPAFSCLEIVDVLYNEVMRSQDIFIMSKGHGCLAQYVVLEDLGRLPPGSLDAYCTHTPGSLGAHPNYDPQRGLHASTGSLGHGLGIAAGQALAEKLKGSDVRVYVLLSDGECQEGSTWEAAMVASNLGLNNLIVLVDANNWNGMDRLSTTHPGVGVFSLKQKFKAFEWAHNVIDGHDSQIIVAAALCRAPFPIAIMCQTIKGRGVSYMENSAIWHYRSPSPEEYTMALKELA